MKILALILMMVTVGRLSAQQAMQPRQACLVLSAEWLLLANDYNEENDERVYLDNQAYFDSTLQQQINLETGAPVNWVTLKARTAAFVQGYARLADQHAFLGVKKYFSITSPDDPAYATPEQPSRVVAWVQSIGDRRYAPGAVLRGTKTHQVGHYTFFRMPTALQDGKSYVIRQWDGREFQLAFDDDTTYCESIKYNQIGYHPDAPEKYAYLGGWLPLVGAVAFNAVTRFEIIDAQTGEVAHSGVPVLRGARDWAPPDALDGPGIPYSGETVFSLSFGSLTREGSYYIRLPGIGRSRDFRISRHVYGLPFYVQARGLFHQRCGTPLGMPHTHWERGACHTSPVFPCALPGNGSQNWFDATGKKFSGIDFDIIRATGDTSGPGMELRGGWHDAADYDRRASHHLALWDVLGAYEMNPAAFTDGQLNLPESSNGIPDLLDEACWGLDIWSQTQRADGAVCGRLETTSHPNHAGMPDNDPSVWYHGQPTRESTMQYAASAAWLARLLQPIDAARSTQLADRAAAAYLWAIRPADGPESVTVTLPLATPDPATGATSRTVTWTPGTTDHYPPGLLAAVELGRLTGDPAYVQAATTIFGPHATRFLKSYPEMLWPVAQLARAPGYDATLIATAITEIQKQADLHLPFIQSNPYRHPWNPAKSRRWGAALPATQARFFLLAHRFTNDAKYLTAARLCADFHLGANPMGWSHTTGLGYRFAVGVQDAETRADNHFEPVPGLTPYGIISVPFSAANEVYRLTVPSSTPGGEATVLSYLPYPYDGINPPIPLWRRLAPHSKKDPLNNEFTLQETLTPTILLFASFMEPGWQPEPDSLHPQPKSPESLTEAIFRLP